jgi:hypothetical protein
VDVLDADLLLIHGFWSSPATWDRLTSRLRADPDLTGLRIHAFGYESPRLPRWSVSATRIPDYNDIAQTLPAYIAAQTPGDAPLVVVTHSQGGLILQRFLAWMLSEGRGRELARIRAIMMLACPNEGSEYLASIRAATGFDRHPQASQLEVLASEVGDARRVVLRQIVHATSLDDHRCPIPIYVYAGRTDNIVTRQSAQSAFPSAEVLPGDHFTIHDPDTPGNLTLPTLKRHVLAAIATTTAGSAIRTRRTSAGQARPHAGQIPAASAGQPPPDDRVDGAAPAEAALRFGRPDLVHAGVDRNLSLQFANLQAHDPLSLSPTHPSYAALDFKCVNRGYADSLITQCQLDIVDFIPDERPALVVEARVETPPDSGPARLVVRGVNNGWGPAEELTLRLRDPVLERIYPASALASTLPVEPGNTFDVLTLGPPTPSEPADAEQLTLSAEVTWRGLTQLVHVQKFPSDHDLLLGPDGFHRQAFLPPLLSISSTGAYAVILSPEGPVSQAFRIDQYIAPGRSDRFHIVLAATVSGTYTLDITFTIDTGRHVRSPPQQIQLWRPRGADLPTGLTPGQPFRQVHGGYRLDRPHVPPPYPRETLR